uniref:Uncharacterized protein n=1 Tax=Rhizophora mucronata TaxID=61149 RepID=A0A2P2QUU6_RHIMU
MHKPKNEIFQRSLTQHQKKEKEKTQILPYTTMHMEKYLHITWSINSSQN